MADANKTTATFALNLESNAPQTGAAVAASLTQLRAQMQADIESAKGLQVALRQLKGGGNVATATVKQLKDQLTAKKAVIADATSRYLKLGGDVRKLAPAGKEATQSLKTLNAAISTAGGPLGRFTARAGLLKQLFAGGALVGASVAVAAAIAAVGVAGTVAAAGVLRFSLAAADARRSELLMLEGLTKLRPTLAQMYFGIGRVADKASFLQDTIDQVSRGVAIGRDQVAGYESEFYRLGLRGGNLQAALEGVSVAAATQGEAGVAQFKAMAMSATFFGGSIRKVADDFKARLGPIAKAQLLSIDTQFAKLRENLRYGFGSALKIEPALNALRSLLRHFDAGSTTMRAFQAILKGIFQPMIDAAPGGASILERFFKGAVLGALDVTVAFLKIRNVLRDSVWPMVKRGISAFDWMKAGKATVYALGAAFVTFAGTIAATVAVMYGMAKPFLLIFDVIGKLVSLPWADIGVNIVKGIASGIRAGIKWVTDAVAEVGKRTLDAFKGNFMIHSPSKLMRDQVGIQLPRGQAEGMRDGRRFIEREVRANVELVRNGSDTAPAATPARAAPRQQQNLGPVHIENINLPQPPPGASVSDIQRMISAGIRDAIVGAALELGASGSY